MILSNQEPEPISEVEIKPKNSRARNSLILNTNSKEYVELRGKRKSTLIIKTYNNETPARKEEEEVEKVGQKTSTQQVERRGSLIYKNFKNNIEEGKGVDTKEEDPL